MIWPQLTNMILCRPPLFHRWPCPKKTKMGLWYTITIYRRQHNQIMGLLSVHGGHVRTKLKRASVPGDCVPAIPPAICYCLGTRQQAQHKVRWSAPCHVFFILSKHWNEHCDWSLSLINIIGMLSCYVEVKTRCILAVFDWVGKWHKKLCTSVWLW